ncbi:HAD family hydrolase [Sutcliffiella horikoshii]|uniref:HAD family hydrolase n=1 Tax=Sutcliffiella horikoshii TaxID=79883 RepID=A0A5D4TC09_9BACI|nr:HAD family hydrolase [Sutcliffiella horikoshii]TYS73147.1 HAD family hydrolase [Sutcliffiella horikoshii]
MIFFDIDGTLLDYDYAEREGILDFFRTNPYLFSFTDQQAIEVWKQLSSEYFEKFLANELSFQEQKRARMIELFKKVEIKITNEEADDKFESYLSLYKKNWKAYADVIEVLDKLKEQGYPLGVISNGDYQQQVEKLQRMGVDKYFNIVITSSEVGTAKPNKSIFIEASKRANSPIENCYYVGDRLDTDALGSKMSGMIGIWLNRVDKQQHPVIIVISSFQELLKLFR